jgi:hypothetical protein
MGSYYEEDDQMSFEDAILEREAADEREAYEQEAGEGFAAHYCGQPD